MNESLCTDDALYFEKLAYLLAHDLGPSDSTVQFISHSPPPPPADSRHPPGSGPSSYGHWRDLRPLRQSLHAARQEEEV